jgi:hypothetical protein
MPPDQIVAAAGADRDDDLYSMVGIPGLRWYRRNAKSESRKCRGDPCQRAAKSKHRIFLGRVGRHNHSLAGPLCGMAQAAATPAAPGFSGITRPVMEIVPGLT